MSRFWRYCNLGTLGIQMIICSLGTFYKHISFGWGLGDLFWYALMYILLIVHLVLTLKGKSKTSNYFRNLTFVFLTITIFTCLKATIWRGVEYRWNGELFYN